MVADDKNRTLKEIDCDKTRAILSTNYTNLVEFHEFVYKILKKNRGKNAAALREKITGVCFRNLKNILCPADIHPDRPGRYQGQVTS